MVMANNFSLYDIIGARVEAVDNAGTTSHGCPMFWWVQLVKPNGETYRLKVARLTKTRLYATRIPQG
jgi:hypothetical protein